MKRKINKLEEKSSHAEEIIGYLFCDIELKIKNFILA